ncbi:hypothetical protein QLG09_17295 [Enterobacter sp. V89_11]|uniref:hypothetical protein n=1 Tax=Enterobacter sp. V89_11 TaxID=3044237 RepID=UPI00249DB200|nr:hypothetical protein [Enterobacter sp. V89_11]MDI3450600.1 hypothetical protein [Enterobacter sp. V89_11]
MTMQMHSMPWPESQAIFLSKTYLYLDMDELCAKLQRTKASIQMRASSMGLYRCGKLTINDLQLIEALLDAGLEHADIASKFELSVTQLVKVLGTESFHCDLCDTFSAAMRSAYWKFDGEPQRTYSCCPACCRAMVESFNAGHDGPVLARRREAV